MSAQPEFERLARVDLSAIRGQADRDAHRGQRLEALRGLAAVPGWQDAGRRFVVFGASF
jgi:hypothetical protein